MDNCTLGYEKRIQSGFEIENDMIMKILSLYISLVKLLSFQKRGMLFYIVATEMPKPFVSDISESVLTGRTGK